VSEALTRDIWLPKEPEEVFAFFADAVNLEKMTPPELRFAITTPPPGGLGAGSLIDYRLRLFGFPFRWRTLISLWDPPSCFVDEQLQGPYRRWVHRHEFIAHDGGTLMRDRVTYELPGGVFGLPARPLVRRQLCHIFDYREAVIRELFSPSSGQ